MALGLGLLSLGCAAEDRCGAFVEATLREIQAEAEATCFAEVRSELASALADGCTLRGPHAEARAQVGPRIAVALDRCTPKPEAPPGGGGPGRGHDVTGALPPMQRSIMPVPGREFIPAGEVKEPEPSPSGKN